MKTFRRLVETLLGAFCVALIVTLTALVLVAVAYRQLGASLTWYDEVATVLLAWLTYYGAAFAMLKRGHLGSPELLMRLPIAPRRVLFVVSEALVIGFFAVVAWTGAEVVVLLKGDGLISLPWVSVQVTQSVMPLGAAMFILCQLLSVRDEWAVIRLGGNVVKESV